MSKQTAIQISAPTSAPTAWTERQAFDLALILEGGAMTIEEYMHTYGLTERTFVALGGDVFFQKRVELYQEEVREHGLTFKQKARLISEDLLKDMLELSTAVDVNPSVRLDSIKSLVRWAGLEPTRGGEKETGGSAPSVTINLIPPPNGDTQPFIDIKPE